VHLKQINKFRFNQLSSQLNPIQSLNAFNQCYFGSHANKKTVEQAVMTQAYQNQIKDYAMMNLSKYVSQQPVAHVPMGPQKAVVE